MFVFADTWNVRFVIRSISDRRIDLLGSKVIQFNYVQAICETLIHFGTTQPTIAENCLGGLWLSSMMPSVQKNLSEIEGIQIHPFLESTIHFAEKSLFSTLNQIIPVLISSSTTLEYSCSLLSTLSQSPSLLIPVVQTTLSLILGYSTKVDDGESPSPQIVNLLLSVFSRFTFTLSSYFSNHPVFLPHSLFASLLTKLGGIQPLLKSLQMVASQHASPESGELNPAAVVKILSAFTLLLGGTFHPCSASSHLSFYAPTSDFLIKSDDPLTEQSTKVLSSSYFNDSEFLSTIANFLIQNVTSDNDTDAVPVFQFLASLLRNTSFPLTIPFNPNSVISLPLSHPLVTQIASDSDFITKMQQFNDQTQSIILSESTSIQAAVSGLPSLLTFLSSFLQTALLSFQTFWPPLSDSDTLEGEDNLLEGEPEKDEDDSADQAQHSVRSLSAGISLLESLVLTSDTIREEALTNDSLLPTVVSFLQYLLDTSTEPTDESDTSFIFPRQSKFCLILSATMSDAILSLTHLGKSTEGATKVMNANAHPIIIRILQKYLSLRTKSWKPNEGTQNIIRACLTFLGEATKYSSIRTALVSSPISETRDNLQNCTVDSFAGLIVGLVNSQNELGLTEVATTPAEDKKLETESILSNLTDHLFSCDTLTSLGQICLKLGQNGDTRKQLIQIGGLRSLWESTMLVWDVVSEKIGGLREKMREETIKQMGEFIVNWNGMGPNRRAREEDEIVGCLSALLSSIQCLTIGTEGQTALNSFKAKDTTPQLYLEKIETSTLALFPTISQIVNSILNNVSGKTTKGKSSKDHVESHVETKKDQAEQRPLETTGRMGFFYNFFGGIDQSRNTLASTNFERLSVETDEDRKKAEEERKEKEAKKRRKKEEEEETKKRMKEESERKKEAEEQQRRQQQERLEKQANEERERRIKERAVFDKIVEDFRLVLRHLRRYEKRQTMEQLRKEENERGQEETKVDSVKAMIEDSDEDHDGSKGEKQTEKFKAIADLNRSGRDTPNSIMTWSTVATEDDDPRYHTAEGLAEICQEVINRFKEEMGVEKSWDREGLHMDGDDGEGMVFRRIQTGEEVQKEEAQRIEQLKWERNRYRFGNVKIGIGFIDSLNFFSFHSLAVFEGLLQLVLICSENDNWVASVPTALVTQLCGFANRFAYTAPSPSNPPISVAIFFILDRIFSSPAFRTATPTPDLAALLRSIASFSSLLEAGLLVVGKEKWGDVREYQHGFVPPLFLRGGQSKAGLLSLLRVLEHFVYHHLLTDEENMRLARVIILGVKEEIDKKQEVKEEEEQFRGEHILLTRFVPLKLYRTRLATALLQLCVSFMGTKEERGRFSDMMQKEGVCATVVGILNDIEQPGTQPSFLSRTTSTDWKLVVVCANVLMRVVDGATIAQLVLFLSDGSMAALLSSLIKSIGFFSTGMDACVAKTKGNERSILFNEEENDKEINLAVSNLSQFERAILRIVQAIQLLISRISVEKDRRTKDTIESHLRKLSFVSGCTQSLRLTWNVKGTIKNWQKTDRHNERKILLKQKLDFINQLLNRICETLRIAFAWMSSDAKDKGLKEGQMFGIESLLKELSAQSDISGAEGGQAAKDCMKSMGIKTSFFGRRK
ncbi:hypothetical protein BLNAU_13041 [Blattamonas nauphoetae]|uniref:Uncharacterized protein n=1 Tax=Blattamonas nauphoetae TaxID=2049346 RepID=A0ABQ9XMM4_9EUKA|nr:hypothetical protein BLNAU_13041 [Blattamonas nauphoetae]